MRATIRAPEPNLARIGPTRNKKQPVTGRARLLGLKVRPAGRLDPSPAETGQVDILS